MNRFDYFKDEETSKTSKRILGYFIDSLMIIIVSIILIFTAGFPILVNNKQFQQDSDTLNNCISEIYNTQADTKLVSLDKTQDQPTLNSQDVIVKEYLNKQIALSYSKDQTKFAEASIVIESTQEIATYENDNLAYYFTTYKYENNIEVEDYGELSPKTYFIEKILKANGGDNYYVFDNEELPYLKAEIAVEAYQYINNKTQDVSTFNDLSGFYASIANLGLKELSSIEAYANAYDEYLTVFNNMANVQNLVMFIAFLIAFIIVIVLPTTIFGNGTTLGRLLSKTRLVYKKKNVGFMILRLVLELVLYMSSLLVINMFTFGFITFTSNIGPIPTMILILIPLFLSIIDVGIVGFTYNKDSLFDIIARTRVVKLNKMLPSKKENKENIVDVESEIKEKTE